MNGINNFRQKVIDFFNNKYVDWVFTGIAWFACFSIGLAMFGLISSSSFIYIWMAATIVILIDRLFSRV